MKRHISSPYKVNWKLYGLIGGISSLIMIVSVICNYVSNCLISDVVKNLAFGCVASTIVALLIEVGNTKEKNEIANGVYDAVYLDLKCQIMWYIQTWARLCGVAYKDKDYRRDSHTWMDWYEITKSNYYKCDDSRKEELLKFFNEQLMFGIEGIENSLKQIDSQQYLLNINRMSDENLRRILGDYNFEFHAARLTLERKCGDEDFWETFDAIKLDLEKYISDWVDIRYYNYYKFKSDNVFVDREELARAMLESDKNYK